MMWRESKVWIAVPRGERPGRHVPPGSAMGETGVINLDVYLEVDFWEAAPSAEGPVDLQNGLVVFVGDDEFRGERVPLLYDVAHWVTGGGLHLQLWGRFVFRPSKYDNRRVKT